MRIDIWSDIACPWCAVGKANLDTALAQFPHEVEVVWRSFELDPGAPAVKEGDYVQLLAHKYGASVAEGQAMIDRMVATGRGVGVELDFTRIRPGNTFDAHRVVHLAAQRGLQGPVKARFLRGYLSEGAAIGEHEEITRLAVEAGLAGGEFRQVLASDAYAQQVRGDEQEAMELGCSGVPFFVMGGRVAVPGAQAPETLLRALEQAWELSRPITVLDGLAADTPVCGPRGCEVQPQA